MKSWCDNSGLALMSMTFSSQTGKNCENELYNQDMYPCALTTKFKCYQIYRKFLSEPRKEKATYKTTKPQN